MAKSVGCGCEGFGKAHREAFIERRDEQFFLADLVGYGMNARLYGPEITHCPFCGAALGKPHELPRATLT